MARGSLEAILQQLRKSPNNDLINRVGEIPADMEDRLGGNLLRNPDTGVLRDRGGMSASEGMGPQDAAWTKIQPMSPETKYSLGLIDDLELAKQTGITPTEGPFPEPAAPTTSVMPPVPTGPIMKAAAKNAAPQSITPPEAEEDPTADRSGRRLALSIIEGLTRAGAEASNVPGLLELMAGKGRGPTDQTTADMLRQARELDQQREDSENSPLRKMVKEAFGVDVKNAEEAKQVIAAEQAKSGLETEAFKRGEGPAAEAAMERQTQQAQEKARAGIYKRRNEIQNSKAYDKISTLIRNAQDAISDIESGNIQSIRAVAIKLARAAGEVGNLSATEQGQYRNLPGFEGWLNRLKEFALSEPTEMTKEALLATAKDYLQNGMRHQNELIANEKAAWLSAYPDTDPEFVDEQFGSLQIGGPSQKKFWATVTKPIGDYDVGDPIEVTEEQFEKYKANLER